MLFNIGFLEALKINDWNCFVFHDVDLLPENDFNIYNCADMPRHMSVGTIEIKNNKIEKTKYNYLEYCDCLKNHYITYSFSFQQSIS